MYFAYNNGYLQANDLQPGKAYWVRATQAGVINLPPKNSPENNTADNRIENGWTKIIITDAAGNTMTLYGLPSVQAGFDLPPVPPAGIFDVRFEGDKLADVISSVKDIRVTGAVYPITIRVEGAEITLRDKETAGKLLNQIIVPGKTVQITNSSVNIIEVSSTMKPTAYELSQNYPNPFNPTTVINFQIPQAGLVSLKVYDAIGTEAATLVNEQKEAGSYSVTFDASRLHSGVYFYTLRSGDFTATKKLLLVK
jgi:hypothetical protein